MSFWQSFPYDPDPEDPRALEVTALGDSVRSFLMPARTIQPSQIAAGMIIADEARESWDLTWAEEAAVRQVQDALTAAGALGPPVTGAPADPAEELRAAIEAAAPSRCRSCGLDDLLPADITGQCRYCAELDALKARNLPGPKLNGWWFTVPAALALALAVLLLYLAASVIVMTA